MIIGLDLDNTLICYDAAFHAAAVAQGSIPATTPRTKRAVRTAVQQRHGDAAWTRLQAIVYGPGISAAKPFPGALAAITRCQAAGLDVRIISHKTRYAADSSGHDLHAAALAWLEHHGLFDTTRGDHGLTRAAVEFHPFRTGKITSIARHACFAFVDDLPEVLGDAAFPTATQRILFDPAGEHAASTAWSTLSAWSAFDPATLLAPTR